MKTPHVTAPPLNPKHLKAMILLALPSGFLGGCVGGKSAQPATQAESGSPSSQSDSAPVDKSKPVPPQAVNAGVCPQQMLVDDFEDGNNRGVLADSRGGYWYTYADPSSTVEPTGSFSPTDGGADDSAYSGGMKGTVGDQQYPYVGLGISFSEPKGPYDASCCKGVSFQGKKNGDGIGNVRLKVGDWQTAPEGGLCKECYNDFGGDFVFTEEWQEFSIDFAEMKQEPYWGEHKMGIEPRALYQLQWQVKEPGRPFDIQIDDVKLVGCGG